MVCRSSRMGAILIVTSLRNTIELQYLSGLPSWRPPTRTTTGGTQDRRHRVWNMVEDDALAATNFSISTVGRNKTEQIELYTPDFIGVRAVMIMVSLCDACRISKRPWRTDKVTPHAHACTQTARSKGEQISYLIFLGSGRSWSLRACEMHKGFRNEEGVKPW